MIIKLGRIALDGRSEVCNFRRTRGRPIVPQKSRQVDSSTTLFFSMSRFLSLVIDYFINRCPVFNAEEDVIRLQICKKFTISTLGQSIRIRIKSMPV